MDVVGCLGCDLLAGRLALPGGIVHQTPSWVVNHVVGPMNLGTLIVGPRDHVVAVADLDDRAVTELGPLLRDTARVVEALCQPEQTYVGLWSHGASGRKHLHIAVQPVTAAVVARHGGLRAEQLQARMLASGEEPDIAEIERFCARARELFRRLSPEEPAGTARTARTGGNRENRREPGEPGESAQFVRNSKKRFGRAERFTSKRDRRECALAHRGGLVSTPM